ncbi:hypothetical protein BEN43_08265 [Leptospira interrogans serovar Bataviae]|nr:hypothetical protein [Leptospira interrogans serovar Bataviae]
MLLILFLPKKGLAPSQSRVVLDWVPGRLELASAHRVLRSRFSLFRKAQNAFQVLASSPRYVVNFISAEEGTRPFTVSRRARLGSGASRTCLSTSCASVAFLAF